MITTKISSVTKPIMLLFILAMITACGNKAHLNFQKVPIEGTVEHFAGKLIAAGYVLADSSNRQEMVLRGDFLGKNSLLHLTGDTVNNMVYKLKVDLPDEGNDSLQTVFGRIQKQFTLWYGQGKSQYQNYKKRERLVYKLPERHVVEGDYSKFTTDSGEIIVEVCKGYLTITYLDRLNSPSDKQTKTQD